MPVPNVSANLVAAWLLNGNAVDSLGTYDFTNTGVDFASDVPSAVASVATQSGQWVQSTDNLARAYNASLNPSQFTLCLWYKAASSSNGAYRTLFDCRDITNNRGWRMYASNGNVYQLWLYNGTSLTIGASTTSVAEGTWQHVAISYNGTSIKVYVNGTLETTTTASHVVNVTEPLRISTNFDSFNLRGLVSDARLYSVALADADIAAIYAGDYGIATTNSILLRRRRQLAL